MNESLNPFTVSPDVLDRLTAEHAVYLRRKEEGEEAMPATMQIRVVHVVRGEWCSSPSTFEVKDIRRLSERHIAMSGQLIRYVQRDGYIDDEIHPAGINLTVPRLRKGLWRRANSARSNDHRIISGYLSLRRAATWPSDIESEEA
jgi:hypothetical protein